MHSITMQTCSSLWTKSYVSTSPLICFVIFMNLNSFWMHFFMALFDLITLIAAAVGSS